MLQNEDDTDMPNATNYPLSVIAKLVAVAVAAALALSASTIAAEKIAAPRALVLTQNSLGKNFICAQDALAKAYRQLGIAVEYKIFPSKRALTIANAGKADGEMLRVAGANLQYPNLIQIPVPICQLTSVVIANGNVSATSFEQMRNYRLGITLGFVDHEHVAQQYKLNVVRVTEHDVLIDMLLKDRVDAIFLTENEAQQLIKKEEGSHLTIVRSLDRDLFLYHYLHKKHQDLVPLITEQLTQLERLGQINRTDILKLPRRNH
ncbi:transporter substrate-binding domain-containing protein [Neiella sp. HB171785]|uniref:Transporter substrate-binding domain-containing protein n=1 Tax=Neiella litorisoli TaxID=2771431 RepID=A0A8J6QQX6_9GAMM|nr:transporter substrate-binding domain-containing protein [Neiella litorisoli]MBD1389751.1 transporter substrate-binding domain-containing protein [Neiella litorisoli]